MASGGVARCAKPVFADEARDLSGEIGLEFSPNGQCYRGSGGGGTASAAGAVASFVVYNALVDALAVRGSVGGVAANLSVSGEGFVAMSEALCSFTPADEDGVVLPGGAVRFGALTVLSPSMAVCSSSAAAVGRRLSESEGGATSGTSVAYFALGVLLNGMLARVSIRVSIRVQHQTLP